MKKPAKILSAPNILLIKNLILASAIFDASEYSCQRFMF